MRAMQESNAWKTTTQYIVLGGIQQQPKATASDAAETAERTDMGETSS